VDFGLVDPAEVQVRLTSLHYVEVRPTGPASDGISIVEAARPPPHAEKISLQAGGRSVQAFSDGDRILLNWQSLPPDIRADLGQLSGALRKDIAAAHPMPMSDEFASHSYSRIANRIAEDPASFRRALTDSLDAQLRRNIELWKSGRFDELQDQLAIGERYVSDLPEFRLQKALVQLERGQPNAAARTINLGVRWPMTRTGGFLNEIEARLADPRVSAQQRANLRALTNYAELSTRTKPGTRLGVEAENGQFHLRYETEEVSKAKYSLTDEKALQKAVIYVEDSPGLNTADWSPSSAPSRLKDWVQNRHVDVQAIQDVDLASFTPSKLVETKSGTKYHLVRSNAASHISTSSRARCQGDNSTEGSEPPCLALLVQQSRAMTNH
jgi:hypothetical protein